MEMIQQLFMAAFVAFAFSILVEKLACVTTNGDDRKSKRPKSLNSTKSKRTSKIRKKVSFALHDQIAVVVNNKLVKLDAIKLPKNKQPFGRTSYDLKDVYLGANWIGEELKMCKEFGFQVELDEFSGIQNQRKVSNDEAQTWLETDDQAKEGKNYNIGLDFVQRQYVD